MSRTKRIALCGMFTALAFGLSYIEMILPLDFAVPGIKLGLANLVILIALYKFRPMDALAINCVRVILVGMLFGNVVALSFSIAGAICSFFVMYLLKRLTGMHIIVVSLLGAITHVLAQLLVGLFYYSPKVIFYYSFFLIISAFITGIIIGILANRINFLIKFWL